MEQWKDIEGYEGLYQVSSLGRIKSLKAWRGNKYKSLYINVEKIIKLSKEKSGYLKVVLHNKNKKQNKRVHRLVAEAFIPNPYNYKCINHKDCNKENNNIDNLEWCTQRYNVVHAINNDLRKFEYKGKNAKYINYDKRNGDFYVNISMNSKKIHLGTFKTIDEAKYVRNMFLKNNNTKLYNKILLLESKDIKLNNMMNGELL